MMSIRMSLTVSLLFLIFISGVGGQDGWEVTYRPEYICALKGSTVIMDCTYSYPENHTVQKAFWTKSWLSAPGVDPPDLLDDPEYRDRVQYLGDKQHNCSLSLTDVRESYWNRYYYFRFTTDKEGGKLQGRGGVYLSVTGLQVKVPERVMEGDNVTLTCKTTCRLTVTPSFTWYRNGTALSSRTEQLYLQSVSREDAGRYSCAVLDQNLHSPEIILSVLCLQVEGPERVIEGGNVTLTCKTTCRLTDRPSFTWYRNGAPLSSRTEQLYLQSVSREDGGRYSCAVLDQNLYSPEFTLSVSCLQVEVPERVMEGDHIILTCKTTCNLTGSPSFTWYKNEQYLYFSSSTEQLYLQSVSREDAGRYSCAVRGQNLHSPEFILSVRYLQVEVPERVMEGDNVTLTCKPSFTLPSTSIFTWFRNGASLSSRTEQLYLQSVSREDKGRYSCYSWNQKLRSPEITLDIRCGPESVSVSIYPSAVVEEGSYVLLDCSSDGNPHLEYTWYKGSSIVSTEMYFRLNKISSVNSGEYKCRSSNEYGEKYSDTVTLNVLYSPKNVSVSISPSGEIVEGSSVTLTCSSDGNPPVQKYTWFKKVNKDVQQKWTGQIYSITNIRSADSGEYQCMATNTQGSRSSEYKSLTVPHPPKSISVSISPSGEIVEGSSVTLTCSSEGNPPVQKYTWFKKVDKDVQQKWTGQIYSITNIRSADSGEYQCMATNTQGSQSSEYKSLTVLYSPKEVWVSIVETALDGSVNLTCSSDGNPPVQKYTWFKEGGGSSPVGSGNSYSAVESGSYYCVAQNKYGSQRAAAVSVTLGADHSMGLYAGVGVGFGAGVGLSAVAAIIVVVLLKWKKKNTRRNKEEHNDQNADSNAQNDTYTVLNPMNRSSNDVYDTLNTAVHSSPSDDV